MIYILGIITGILLSLVAVVSYNPVVRTETKELFKRGEKGGIIDLESNDELIHKLLEED